MKRKVLFAMILLISLSLNANILWEETFDKNGSQYVEKDPQGYWPYASGDAAKQYVFDNYSTDYDSILSYACTVRSKKLNGDTNNTPGFNFRKEYEAKDCYLTLAYNFVADGAGKYFLFEISTDQTIVDTDLSKMAVKVNDNVVNVPAFGFPPRGITGTVAIALPAGAINKLHWEFDHLAQQVFMTHPRITDDIHSLDVNLNIGAEQGGVVNTDVNGIHYLGEPVTITATPNVGYHFYRWSDGNTDASRTLVMNRDCTLTASFLSDTKYNVQVNAGEHGSVNNVNGDYYGLSQINVYATPQNGYYFNQWSDGNTDNPRTLVLTKDTSLTAEFAKTYTLNVESDNLGYVDYPCVGCYNNYDIFEISAIPEQGCYFVRWSDGNKDNPRTIVLTQDTTFTAIFDYLLTGKCGKDNALTWTFTPSTMALSISDEGALSENYSYGSFIESLTIGNEITQIGEDAFRDFGNLKNVILGAGVKVLEQNAFYNCSAIQSITCYSMRPPTVNSNALYGLDYSTIVYVPADYLNTYIMHDAWGLYDVRPLGATNTDASEVQVTPTDNTADIVWPAVSAATSYELTIKDSNGTTILTLIFNSEGRLMSIAFAPSRTRHTQTQSTGFSFTVTGLDCNTSYSYAITSKNSEDEPIDIKSGSFTTTGTATSVDKIVGQTEGVQKVLRNGQLYILRDGEMYNAQGVRVE